MAARDEMSSLFGCKQKQTSYGATRKQDNTNEFYIKHAIKTGETLAGICLKYGVQMEAVKRINKIWTNDSLFMREILLIPVQRDPIDDCNGTSCNKVNTNKTDASVELLSRQDLKSLQNSSKPSNMQTDASQLSNEPTVNDFLSRVDTTLNKLRVNVERLDRSTEFMEDVTNPLSFLPSKKTARYSHRPRSNGSSSDSEITFHSSGNVEPMVCQSLDRFNEVHEDMFKL